MPSNNPKAMESAIETIPTDQTLYWNVDEPAAENEKAEFWKKLRSFYRTGDKNTDEIILESPALIRFLKDEKSPYPYALSEDLKIDLNNETPLVMLSHALSTHKRDHRKKFKSQLVELVDSLNRLLKLENPDQEASDLKNTYDFADELIAFDKIVEMIPHQKNEMLQGSRMSRIQEIVATMKSGLAHYNDLVANIILDKELKRQMEVHKLFEDVRLVRFSEDAFAEAQHLFIEEMGNFTELIKSYRIALLEVNGEYDEDIHEEYFHHFNWHRFLDEELSLFPPMVILVEHAYLFEHLTTFSRLLASNLPINIVVLNHQKVSNPNKAIDWEDASHQSRQELATLAMSHRNVKVMQTGLDNPELLLAELHEALKVTSPVVCHLSVPTESSKSINEEILIAKAAAAGRYFPKITLQPNSSLAENSTCDISANIQKEEVWPLFTLKAKNSKETEAMMDVGFTYADYKAIFPEKAKELMTIPSKYYSDHLIPLSEYLLLEEQKLYGVIPYIWLVNNQNELIRAAVPYMWVLSCQERMEFWNHLRTLAGGREATSATSTEVPLTDTATHGVSSLSEEHLTKIEKEALSRATERLISALLSEDL
jgi:hypothetical protein